MICSSRRVENILLKVAISQISPSPDRSGIEACRRPRRPEKFVTRRTAGIGMGSSFFAGLVGQPRQRAHQAFTPVGMLDADHLDGEHGAFVADIGRRHGDELQYLALGLVAERTNGCAHRLDSVARVRRECGFRYSAPSATPA